jgi:hypothetical protein
MWSMMVACDDLSCVLVPEAEAEGAAESEGSYARWDACKIRNTTCMCDLDLILYVQQTEGL